MTGTNAGQLDKKDNAGPEKDEMGNVEDFDDLLEIVGSSGRYQKTLLYGVIGPITALTPLFVLNALFLLSDQDHWCHVPGNGTSFSLDLWKNLTLPLEVGPDGNERLSQCSMYNSSSYDGLGDGSPVPCQHGWNFDQTNYESTIVTAFGWVCEKKHYATTVFTVQTIGAVVGLALFGNMTDRVGRKPVLFFAVLLDSIFRICNLFVVHIFHLYVALSFLSSFVGASYGNPSLIASEISGKEYRSWIFCYIWIIWVAGMATLPLIAFLARSWFFFGLITTIPTAIILLFYPFVPESPRWLLSRGRISEAAKIMENIAEKNGKGDKFQAGQLEASLEYLHRKEKAKGDKVRVWSLFTKPRLAKNTLMLAFSLAANGLVYGGITLNIPNIPGNQFLIFFVLAVIEVPSGLVGGFLVEKIGRRLTNMVFFLISAAACFATATSEMGNYTVAFIMTAKFAINLTSFVGSMQGTEIFPTALRSTGQSFASLFASCIGTVTPYMVYLGKVNASLPHIVMGISSIVGLLATSWIPESRNRKLPHTLAEANDLGKEDSYFGCKLKTKEGKDIVQVIEHVEKNADSAL